jgi:hypothetical protein
VSGGELGAVETFLLPCMCRIDCPPCGLCLCANISTQTEIFPLLAERCELKEAWSVEGWEEPFRSMV